MKYFTVFLYALIGFSCSNKLELARVTRVAFGSCGNQATELPIFNKVVQHQPDLFVFLGDNIYGDTNDMEVLKEKYEVLGRLPSFQNLKKNVPIIATWDDHDYGWNDIGRHYPFKVASKEIFLDFWEEPTQSKRREHKGIYTSYLYEEHGRKLQVILLDNRTFRDDLKRNTGEFKDDSRYFYNLDYAPYKHSDSTLLGAEQWQWLEGELEKDADVRIIGSGSQFGIEYNGYESWANFPKEQERLLDLIKKKRANGVVFITGDVHYAEVSKLAKEGQYPIYDITSSGLSSTWHFATPNKNRIEGPVMENHFGMISIHWDTSPVSLQLEVIDINDNQRIEHTINLPDISF